MLRAAFVQEVPSSGLPVTIVAGQEVSSLEYGMSVVTASGLSGRVPAFYVQLLASYQR